MKRPAGCEDVRAAAEELALGQLAVDESARLYAHAAGCADCRRYLDALTALTDQLLLVAPELEPPPGFEARALVRLGKSGAAPVRSRRWFAAGAAAVALLASATIGYLVSEATSGDDVTTASASTSVAPRAARQAKIIRADGSTAGTVFLSATPRAHLLITIDSPRPFNGQVTCELVSANGYARTVGSWVYDDIQQGAWAIGIDPWLLSAAKMVVRDAAGAVAATAEFA